MDRKTFSYPVDVGHLSANPVHVTLEADARERDGLAERWGVISVELATAQADLSRWKRDGVRVKGTVEAHITQACVISLEPVKSVIAETFEALFVPEGSRLARVETSDVGEMIIEAEGPDAPETFAGDSIDVGQVCEEFIVLSINPYPRKQGVELTFEADEPGDDEAAESPFAGLRDYGRRQQ